MQNLNNFLSDLQNWYNAKYNGETNLPKIGKIAEKHGFEYVEGRYLVVNGEKIRLDKLCKQNGIDCNYKTGVKRTVENGTRVSRSKKTDFNFNGEKHTVVKLDNETTETVDNWLVKLSAAKIEADMKAAEVAKAREILSDEISDYEKTIAELQSKLAKLEAQKTVKTAAKKATKKAN